jgi:hypothetical protein
LEDLAVDERIILIKWILKEDNGRICTGLMWLRIGTRARFLSTWY